MFLLSLTGLEYLFIPAAIVRLLLVVVGPPAIWRLHIECVLRWLQVCQGLASAKAPASQDLNIWPTTRVMHRGLKASNMRQASSPLCIL